jgi:hypothetical protein
VSSALIDGAESLATSAAASSVPESLFPLHAVSHSNASAEKTSIDFMMYPREPLFGRNGTGSHLANLVPATLLFMAFLILLAQAAGKRTLNQLIARGRTIIAMRHGKRTSVIGPVPNYSTR